MEENFSAEDLNKKDQKAILDDEPEEPEEELTPEKQEEADNANIIPPE